jgi:hypothetical protein
MLLNHRKPEHPPDIYFIRRNPRLLEHYLNERQMQRVVDQAQPSQRLNYALFKLDPVEKLILRQAQTRKRVIVSKDDPFKQRKPFLPQLQGVQHTDRFVKELSPTNHTKLLGKSPAQIKDHSA